MYIPRRIAARLCSIALLSTAALNGASAATVGAMWHADLGVTVVQLDGRIEKGDEQKVRHAIADVLQKTPRTDVFLSLRSPGGAVDEALAIGRYLRAEGFGTVLLPGAQCFSACAFVFFAGAANDRSAPRRIAFRGSRLGVHRSALTLSPAQHEKLKQIDPRKIHDALQIKTSQLISTLTAFGVPIPIQEKMFATEHGRIYLLSEAEMREGRIALVSGSPGGGWRVFGESVPLAQLPPGLREQPTPHVASAPQAKRDSPGPANPTPPSPGLVSGAPLTRTAIAGRALKLGHWLALEPNCAPIGQTEIRILSKPSHGTFEVKYGDEYPNFPANNVRNTCNKATVPATQLWYMPNTAFAGADNGSVLVVFPTGSSRSVSYQINVVP